MLAGVPSSRPPVGVEHDAAVADGATRRAGAVTCVSGIRNPVLAARAVLERTPYVLMSGAGAQELARREGLTFMPTDWFVTARRREQLTGIPPSNQVEPPECRSPRAGR